MEYTKGTASDPNALWEGTGGQGMALYPWVVGGTNRFLLGEDSGRQDGHHRVEWGEPDRFRLVEARDVSNPNRGDFPWQRLLFPCGPVVRDSTSARARACALRRRMGADARVTGWCWTRARFTASGAEWGGEGRHQYRPARGMVLSGDRRGDATATGN